MAILNFQKPDKIILQKATDFEAQFEFRPLEPVMALPLAMHYVVYC
jgi:DNA-directed RNA polymerase subunit alpha